MRYSLRVARHLFVLGLSIAVGACGGDDGGAAVDSGADVAPESGSDAPGTGGGGSGGSSGSGSGGADAGLDAAPDALVDTTPFVCDFEAPVPAAAPVLWAAPLSQTGAATLGGHGHDDGKGPVGFCPGTPVSGQPYYRLIAAGFETDEDVTNDGDQNDPLPVDFWKDAASFAGVGESGGRVNIYVQIVDAGGNVLNVDNSPEIRVEVETLGGSTQSLPLTSKPANEFQTNFPMTGGGTRYGISIEGASDRVINMRLPVNHHVCYVLVFRRET